MNRLFLTGTQELMLGSLLLVLSPMVLYVEMEYIVLN